jgi:peptide/nickel transport system ATP-binding protein
VKLQIRDLSVSFGERRVVAIEELDVDSGEIVGLVGESGSGKSMTAWATLGLARGMGATVAGSIRLDDSELTALREDELRHIRGRRIAMILQSPVAAFNPVFRLGEIVVRTLRLHGAAAGEARQRAVAALAQVRLGPEILARYPHEVSGGQAQRVAIALALALRAEVLVADEPTSALDVTVQDEILALVRSVADRQELAVLFITHDLAVVAELCDRVAVMRAGAIVEAGPVGQMIAAPAHAFTRELVAAVPRLGRA